MPKKIEEVDARGIRFEPLRGLRFAPEGIIRSSHYEIINGKKVKVIDDIKLTGVSLIPTAENPVSGRGGKD